MVQTTRFGPRRGLSVVWLMKKIDTGEFYPSQEILMGILHRKSKNWKKSNNFWTMRSTKNSNSRGIPNWSQRIECCYLRLSTLPSGQNRHSATFGKRKMYDAATADDRRYILLRKMNRELRSLYQLMTSFLVSNALQQSNIPNNRLSKKTSVNFEWCVQDQKYVFEH